MTATVFCLDFDETLMNTDRLRVDLLDAIQTLGRGLSDTFQEAYEATRQKHGVPRIPLVLQTMVEHYELDFKTHSQIADIFHTFPYQDYIYDGVDEVITHLKKSGKVLLLSDGDAFFQPQKIYMTSVKEVVDGIVIVPGKIDYFDDLSGYYPAEKYVFIDDKQKVLDAAKSYFGEQATTVLVEQGRYADRTVESTADISVSSIAEIATLEF